MDEAEERRPTAAQEADQEYTIYSLLPPARRAASSSLSWLTVPPSNLTVHEGKILTLQCALAGEKPIGRSDPGLKSRLKSGQG